MKKYIQFADFKHLLRVPDGEEEGEWCHWLSVRRDGVYFKILEENPMLTTTELMIAFDFLEDVDFARVKGNPKVLSFPCELSDLEDFITEQGLSGAINAFDLVNWLTGGESSFERENDLGLELDFVINEMRRAVEPVTPTTLWNKLRLRAGRKDSIILTVTESEIEWRGPSGSQTLTFDALKARLRRWKRRQNVRKGYAKVR